MVLNCPANVGHAYPMSASPMVQTRSHSQARSQPKLCTHPGISTTEHMRKLSTVQASPLIKPQYQFIMETDSHVAKDMCKAQEVSNAHQEQTLISLNSNSSLRCLLAPQ